jgi:hypothetical protein
MAKEGRYGAGSHRTEGVAQRFVENVCLPLIHSTSTLALYSML